MMGRTRFISTEHLQECQPHTQLIVEILDLEPQKTVPLPCKVLDFEPQQEALAGYKDGENLTAHIQPAQMQHIYCNLQHTVAAFADW